MYWSSQGSFANIALSPLSGDSWTTTWLTSVRKSNGPDRCVPDFTFAPFTDNLVFLSGQLTSSTLYVNSVGQYSGGVGFSASVSGSGLSVSCSHINLPAGQTVGGFCFFSSSTPGIYSVNITGASGPMSHWQVMTVVVANAQFSSTGSFDGWDVILTILLYQDGTTYRGRTSVSATSGGLSVYDKTRDVIFPGGETQQFVVEVANHDAGMINILDLANVALFFGRTCPSGPCGYSQVNCAPFCAFTADLTTDGIVDIRDLTLISIVYGERVYPP